MGKQVGKKNPPNEIAEEYIKKKTTTRVTNGTLFVSRRFITARFARFEMM